MKPESMSLRVVAFLLIAWCCPWALYYINSAWVLPALTESAASPDKFSFPDFQTFAQGMRTLWSLAYWVTGGPASIPVLLICMYAMLRPARTVLIAKLLTWYAVAVIALRCSWSAVAAHDTLSAMGGTFVPSYFWLVVSRCSAEVAELAFPVLTFLMLRGLTKHELSTFHVGGRRALTAVALAAIALPDMVHYVLRMGIINLVIGQRYDLLGSPTSVVKITAFSAGVLWAVALGVAAGLSWYRVRVVPRMVPLLLVFGCARTLAVLVLWLASGLSRWGGGAEVWVRAASFILHLGNALPVLAVLLWYWWPYTTGQCVLAWPDAEPRCEHCGYILRGNLSGVCPECGAATGRGDA